MNMLRNSSGYTDTDSSILEENTNNPQTELSEVCCISDPDNQTPPSHTGSPSSFLNSYVSRVTLVVDCS